jgi:hypothetical protein
VPIYDGAIRHGDEPLLVDIHSNAGHKPVTAALRCLPTSTPTARSRTSWC